MDHLNINAVDGVFFLGGGGGEICIILDYDAFH